MTSYYLFFTQILDVYLQKEFQFYFLKNPLTALPGETDD